MTELHLLSAANRRPFFESAVYDLQIPFEIIEKDYKEMEAMFFRAIPDWKHILETIEKFER